MATHHDRTYRFYCPEIPVQGQIALPEGEAHHAMHVLRLGCGAEVTLFDGRGMSVCGNIATVSKREVVVVISGQPKVSAPPAPPVHVAFAVPKGKRLDWLLEKASELGASSLWPVIFERSVAGGDRLSESQLARWQGHCVSAAKQCGSDFLPPIAQPSNISGVIARAAGCLCVLGDCSGPAEGILTVLEGWNPQQGVCLLVGPEGGLTDSERSGLREAGFVSAVLGQTTLRIETAVAALLACARAKQC